MAAILAWVILSVIILLAVIALVAKIISKKKGKQKKPDYYAYFIMGSIWIPFGWIMSYLDSDWALGNIFFILGWVYFVIGIANKDKWKKDRKPYLIQTPWLRWIVTLGLGALLAIGIIFYILTRS